MRNYTIAFLLTLLSLTFLINQLRVADVWQSQLKEYQEWKHTFGISFLEEEELYRFFIFKTTKEEIIHHNLYSNTTYKKGINQFAAITDQQFQHLLLKPYRGNKLVNYVEQPSRSNPLKIEIDWVARGMVSPVKNQGNCASCWAFSAVAILESFALLNHKSLRFSQQQLVDCSQDYGNSRCYGGFNFNALQYIKDKGIVVEKLYPYKAVSGDCLIDGGDFKIKTIKYAKGCVQLYAEITLRPLGVTVDAVRWRTYSSGIFNDCDKAVNHDVLLVGLYPSYYILKNSWGTTWGQQGFIRLALGNTCGICSQKSSYVQ